MYSLNFRLTDYNGKGNKILPLHRECVSILLWSISAFGTSAPGIGPKRSTDGDTVGERDTIRVGNDVAPDDGDEAAWAVSSGRYFRRTRSALLGSGLLGLPGVVVGHVGARSAMLS